MPDGLDDIRDEVAERIRGDGVTARDLRSRGQQYRGFSPDDFRVAAQTTGQAEARAVLTKIVESGRFGPFLEEVSSMFSRLDADEQELFTRRNPDLVQWMSVYNELQDLNPYSQYDELAEDVLTGDRTHAERDKAPLFERPEMTEDTLLKDMRFRRRSYRNWSPYEFRDLLNQGVDDAEVREVLERVEAGRFEPVLETGHKFFAPLDPDERRLFARRNPGIMEWVSVWGRLQHLIHGDELFPLSDLSFPLLQESQGE